MDDTTSSNTPDETILRDVHGRKLNSTNDSYMLPADLAEHARLDVQHEMLKSAAGGLFLAQEAVRRALSPRSDGTAPKILDIGTGSGTWVVDMANAFPHAEVVGLDLAPVNPASSPPPNCRFVLGDCNTYLDEPSYHRAFDVIQARCIVNGVLDYRKLLQDVLKSLRPGGVFLVLEGRLTCCSEDRRERGVQDENDPEYSWQHNLVSLAREAIVARNDQITHLDEIPTWLREMGDVWEEVGEKTLWIPIGPWNKETPALVFQGEAMRQNCLKFTESAQPLLLSRGHSKEQVQKWTDNARKELESSHLRQWSKWGGVWAIKRRNSSD